MIGVLALGGLYLYLRDEDDMKKPDGSDTSGRSGDEPSLPPKPVMPEGDDYRVEKVATGERSNIYLLESRRGVLYDDGSGGYSWEQTGYIRGDYPTGFTSAPTSLGGTISFEINETYYENVIVYGTEQAAIEADKIPEEDPTGPQKQPEDDEGEDEGGQPTFPTRPPTGLPGFGGGVGSYFGGGY